MKKDLYFGERILFAARETHWSQKTLALGGGRFAKRCEDYEYRYYLIISVCLIFWFVTFGVRLSKKAVE